MNLKHWKRLLPALLLSAAAAFSACSESDDPFDGADNYVVSFSLVKDGATFTADLSGDRIIMTAPQNVSLNNASAQIALSENATIYPDPAQITDWDNDRIFVVTSYGGTDRTYTYTIERDGNACMQNVTLNSQADVDAFAANGYNVVYGSLRIGEATDADAIESLAALRTLREVTANLVIGTAYSAENLDGLDNLKTVGSLIVTSATLPDVTLPALEQVKANATLAGENVFTVSLPRLTQIGGDLSAQVPVKNFDLSALQTVGGDLSYYVTEAGVMPSLVFQSLQEVGGKLTVEMVLNVRKGALSTLDLPQLTRCAAFTVGTIEAMNTIYAPNLAQVDGTFDIGANNYIEASFPALKSVGTWTVSSLGEDLDLRGCTIGKLVVTGNAFAATEPKTIIGDETFDGDLVIESSLFGSSPFKAMPRFEGFASIKSLTLDGFWNEFEFTLPDTKIITGDVEMYTPRFTNNCLPALEEVGGNLNLGTLQSYAEEVFEMPALKRVGGKLSLAIYGNTTTSLTMPSLEEVGGDLELGTYTAIGDIRMTSLKKVGGTLSLIPDLKATPSIRRSKIWTDSLLSNRWER